MRKNGGVVREFNSTSLRSSIQTAQQLGEAEERNRSLQTKRDLTGKLRGTEKLKKQHKAEKGRSHLPFLCGLWQLRARGGSQLPEGKEMRPTWDDEGRNAVKQTWLALAVTCRESGVLLPVSLSMSNGWWAILVQLPSTSLEREGSMVWTQDPRSHVAPLRGSLCYLPTAPGWDSYGQTAGCKETSKVMRTKGPRPHSHSHIPDAAWVSLGLKVTAMACSGLGLELALTLTLTLTPNPNP